MCSGRTQGHVPGVRVPCIHRPTIAHDHTLHQSRHAAMSSAVLVQDAAGARQSSIARHARHNAHTLPHSADVAPSTACNAARHTDSVASAVTSAVAADAIVFPPLQPSAADSQARCECTSPDQRCSTVSMWSGRLSMTLYHMLLLHVVCTSGQRVSGCCTCCTSSNRAVQIGLHQSARPIIADAAL